MKNAPRAKSIQGRFSFYNENEFALKYAMAEMREATKASKTKKCPTRPGNKCSPSNFIWRLNIE
jgi:hypothetical protein